MIRPIQKERDCQEKEHGWDKNRKEVDKLKAIPFNTFKSVCVEKPFNLSEFVERFPTSCFCVSVCIKVSCFEETPMFKPSLTLCHDFPNSQKQTVSSCLLLTCFPSIVLLGVSIRKCFLYAMASLYNKDCCTWATKKVSRRIE